MCDVSSLAEVTLIVHCRQKIEICKLRKPLLLSYRPFFKELVFFLKYDFDISWANARRCYGAGDPFWCISEEMHRTKSLGILYMQFDVAISPCSLARKLHIRQVGHFEDLAERYFTFDLLDRCRSSKDRTQRCWWYHWQTHENRSRLMKCWPALEKVSALRSRWVSDSGDGQNGLANAWNRTLERDVLRKLSRGIWWSIGDFFYIPSRAFSVFASYAPVFREERIHHELASPTLLAMSALLTGVGLSNFGCVGSCCSKIVKAELLAEDFACGHRMDYRDLEEVEALKSLMPKMPDQSGLWSSGSEKTLAHSATSEITQPLCDVSSLAQITLILHCRQKIEHCTKRRQLLRSSYKDFFKEIVFFLKYEYDDTTWENARRCDVADPFGCIAKEMQHSNASGILYMQFDVVLSPCALARRIDIRQVGHFEELFDKYISFKRFGSM